MKLSTSLCGVAVAALLLPGCATVTRGTKQKFVIESTPSEAQVALSTGATCVTPCKLKLKRKHGFDAKITKEGYEPAEVTVKSKFSGGGAVAGAGNVLIGGVIGGIVDGTNGSLNNLEPNPLVVKLVPLAAEPAAVPTAAATDPSAPPATAEAADAPAAATTEAGAPAPSDAAAQSGVE